MEVESQAISRCLMIIAALCLLAVSLSACGDDSPASNPTPMPAIDTPLSPTATSTSSPTKTPAPSPTPPPTTPPPTPVPSPTPSPTAVPTPASEPSPETLSAKEVLDSTTAAMSALDSGYIEIEVTTKLSAGDESQQIVTMEIVGEFQAPDRSRVNMSVDADDDSAEFEVITIEDTTYLKLPGFDRWAISTGSVTPYGDLFSFGAFSTNFDAGVVASFDSPIREVFAGESVHTLRGPVSGYALADLLGIVEDTDGEDVAEFGEGVVEFRIGVDDFLVRKMVIEAELPDPDEEGTLSVQIIMTLSDFGKPVDIQTPDPESDDEQTGATTEILENGWVRVDLAQQGFGFAISVPPSWELDTTKDEGFNPRSTRWLSGQDTAGPDFGGVHAQFQLQIDVLFYGYADLEEYTEIYIANTPSSRTLMSRTSRAKRSACQRDTHSFRASQTSHRHAASGYRTRSTSWRMAKTPSSSPSLRHRKSSMR